jgi:dTDP-4-dehydrorhamnose reductase
MRILITGARGQLGCALQRALTGHQLTLLSRPAFDLTKPGIEDAIVAARPDVVIHAAAYTDVDGAEREPELAWAVNAEGTARVAQAVTKAHARLLYISTDYVFDGARHIPYAETDEPNPINVYGQSKLAGEQQALALCPKSLVVRTAWLYGATGKNFVKTIVRLAFEQAELRVVSDQRGSPTYAGDLACALAQLLVRDAWAFESRTLHLAGTGDCTWYEFACEIVSLIGAPARVRPIATEESNRPARRPAYSVLANHVLAQAGIALPHWKEALERFVREEGGRFLLTSLW